MKIKYYGVRGSIPVPGKDTVKYGGNTTCVFIEQDDTFLVFDAGTGIRNLGRDLLKRGFTGQGKLHMFFSHYHWDHIQAFPFFTPAFIKGNEINLYGETKYNQSIKDVLKKQQEFINFPVELSGMMSKLHFLEIMETEPTTIGPFNIKIARLNHPGGVLGFRVETKTGAFVFATDIEHFSVPDNKLIELSKNASILMYDAHFTPEEYPKYIGWGHSTYEEGIKVAQLANVKELHLCHHAPEHTDAQIDDLQRNAQAKFQKTYAIQEGWEVQV